MIEVGRQAAVVLIEDNKTGDLLFCQYDQTYPVKIAYRGRINPMGGGHTPEKDSKKDGPFDLVCREVREELSPAEVMTGAEMELENLADMKNVGLSRKLFASGEDIAFIREAIIKNMIPYQDFLGRIPEFVQGKNKDPFSNIYSYFVSIIPHEVFECAKTNLQAGKDLTNEGLLRIVSTDELNSGKVLAAWITAPALRHYRGLILPNPERALAIPFGLPRESFKDYFSEFHYDMSFKD